jgi:p-hydroxybenzoate 3-monooxygenase
MTRFMLEVPAREDYGQWGDDRIWAELELRLTAAGRPAIQRGEFIERDILDHRVRVRDPMQHGRVFLAGDAAHLITPAGGKGMNIAIQDAVELASGLCERFGPRKDDRRLSTYSQTRLPQVWRHQEFSNLMLSLFNAGPANGGEARDFSYGLRHARLDPIVSDPKFSRWFAHAYAGVDE